MGFFRLIGKVAGRIVDVRVDRWVSLNYVKDSFKQMTGSFRYLFVPAEPLYQETFEEAIMLIRANSKEMAAKKVTDHWRSLTKELTYENAIGGKTTWCLVQVLDCFEFVNEMEGDIDFKEVYARYILAKSGTTALEVIHQYSLDK